MWTNQSPWKMAGIPYRALHLQASHVTPTRILEEGLLETHADNCRDRAYGTVEEGVGVRHWGSASFHPHVHPHVPSHGGLVRFRNTGDDANIVTVGPRIMDLRAQKID
jgi:hypothetical protein